MVELLAAAILGLVAVNSLLLFLLWKRPAPVDPAPPLAAIREGVERSERGLRDELGRSREEGSSSARQLRDETAHSVKTLGDGVLSRMAETAQLQKGQLETFSGQLSALTQLNEQKLEAVRQAVEAKLTQLQAESAQKLEQMRATVDEKLQATLETRLGVAFRQVSERLEQMHKGLGEMQALASGVGDLKKVLANIKTRGTWGEISLGNLLEQMLTPDQYSANVAPDPLSSERVEFAVRLPGKDEDGKPLWLPIDAKFPLEDYQRLLEAQDRVDPEGVEASAAALETRIRIEARKIREKYIRPPHTTDFAILFLPTEGLFAEALRRIGLYEAVLREHRVVITGPTTLSAVLSSLQMGFRTLAIEKRSSEVWAVLGAVKSQFSLFGEALGKVKRKLDEASSSIETAETRSRAVERRLKTVQEVSSEDAAKLLGRIDGLGEDGDGEPSLPPAAPRLPAG